MLKNTLRRQLEKHFADTDLARWFDPLALDMDEGRGILRVSFPHAYFGRWFMSSVQRDFEQQALSVLKDIQIIYDRDDFVRHKFYFTPRGSATGNEFTSTAALGKTPRDHGSILFSLPLSGSGVRTEKQEYGDKAFTSGNPPLMEEYSFGTFLLNRKNDLPVAAAKECSRGRHSACTPFVLYGQSGCGKSHLLGAMANELNRLGKPFMFGGIELLETLAQTPAGYFAGDRQGVFIDDAHRISSHPHLQDTLIALIDNLCVEKKLLALVFDMHPSHCSGLQQKLRSRLNSGLVMEVKRPDLDIRTQYVQRQNREYMLELSKDIVLAIARRYQDIRSIDGFVAKLRFSRSMRSQSGSAEAHHVLDPLDLLNRDEAPGYLTHTHIITTVARYFTLSPEDITGKSRDKKVSAARHMAVLLCKELLGLSLAQVGHIFGGRDHTSVLHSIKRIKQLQASNKDMHNKVETLRKLCLSRQ